MKTRLVSDSTKLERYVFIDKNDFVVRFFEKVRRPRARGLPFFFASAYRPFVFSFHFSHENEMTFRFFLYLCGMKNVKTRTENQQENLCT